MTLVPSVKTGKAKAKVTEAKAKEKETSLEECALRCVIRELAVAEIIADSLMTPKTPAALRPEHSQKLQRKPLLLRNKRLLLQHQRNNQRSPKTNPVRVVKAAERAREAEKEMQIKRKIKMEIPFSANSLKRPLSVNAQQERKTVNGAISENGLMQMASL